METTIKTRHIFMLSLRHLLKACVLFGRGCYSLMRHLFTNFPNITWACIAGAIVAYSFVKVAKARTERDRYSYENARLIEQLDSVENWSL